MLFRSPGVIVIVGILVFSIATPLGAWGVVINFDDRTGPGPLVFLNTRALRGKYVRQGVTFHAPGNDGGAIVRQAGNFGVTGQSPPNFLGFNPGTTLGDGGVPSLPQTIAFAAPVNGVRFWAGADLSAGQRIIAEAFDAGSSSLGIETLVLDRALAPVALKFPGIVSVTITSETAPIFVIDNLGFNVACDASPDLNCTTRFGRGRLLVNEKKAGRQRLIAKFLAGPALPQTDFGDQLHRGAPSHALCIYGEEDTLVAELGVDRGGDTCGDKSCWRPIGGDPPSGVGFRYKDKDTMSDGVEFLKLQGGEAGKSKLLVKAVNNSSKGHISMPTGVTAALEGNTSAMIQIHSSDGSCFSAHLTDVERADRNFFKAKM